MLGVVLLAALGLTSPAASADAGGGGGAALPQIRFAAEHLRVDVEGLAAEEVTAFGASRPSLEVWRRVLRVVAVDTDKAVPASDLPALLGSYEVAGGAIRFIPRFRPAPGLVLEAFFDGARWDAALQAARASRARPPGAPATPSVRGQHLVPEPAETEATRVLAISPRQRVPSNLLRFYIHFSAPMSARHVLPHVSLLEEAGAPISQAFVEIPGGLWDRDRTRLTLFVHPGRVKRGVGPGQVLGPVLETGGSYRLRVDGAARDAAGRRIASDFKMLFSVGPEDRTSPDPGRWRLVAPRSAHAALVVELDQPADRALLERLPAVLDAGGRQVAGDAEVDAMGQRLSFVPERPWTPGTYRLAIPPTLEDPAGNRLDRLFEEKPGSGATGATVYLSFDVVPR